MGLREGGSVTLGCFVALFLESGLDLVTKLVMIAPVSTLAVSEVHEEEDEVVERIPLFSSSRRLVPTGLHPPWESSIACPSTYFASSSPYQLGPSSSCLSPSP